MKLTKDECIELILKAESSKMGRVDTNERRKYSTVGWILYSGELFDKINKYCFENIGIRINKLHVNILKYNPGDLFERHIDRHKNLKFNQKFVFNINAVLNDEFEGGEFYLEDVPYIKDVGEVYHYNSTQYHEVKPITSGTRYSVLFVIFEDDIDTSSKKLV